MLGFLKKRKAAEPEMAITWEETLHPAVKYMPVEEVEEDDDWLPFGWVYENRAFVERIRNEWSYLLDSWIEKRNAHPVETYGALKSVVLYLEDAQKLCRQMSENHAKWFDGIIANQDYIDKMKAELADLEANMDAYIKKYNDQQELEAYEATLTDEMMFDAIRQHEGMLQKDLCKLFPYPKVISSKLYYMEKEGKIERTKSGNSYILKIKK